MNASLWWSQYGAMVWLALGIAFAVAEGLTTQMISIWFALGAAAAAAAIALFHVKGPAQFWIFLIVSAVLLIATRPLAKKVLYVKKETTNADRVIGLVGVVLEAIDNDRAQGRVKANGLDWSARSSDGSEIPAGEKVTVLAIEGVKLIVEPHKERNL